METSSDGLPDAPYFSCLPHLFCLIGTFFSFFQEILELQRIIYQVPNIIVNIIFYIHILSVENKILLLWLYAYLVDLWAILTVPTILGCCVTEVKKWLFLSLFLLKLGEKAGPVLLVPKWSMRPIELVLVRYGIRRSQALKNHSDLGKLGRISGGSLQWALNTRFALLSICLERELPCGHSELHMSLWSMETLCPDV